MRVHLACGVYDIFLVVEPTKKSRFFLLNPCAQASRVQFKLCSPDGKRIIIIIIVSIINIVGIVMILISRVIN